METSADASANADQCQAGLHDNVAPPELPTPGANFVSDFDATLPSRRYRSSRGPRLRTSQSGTPSQPAAACRAWSQTLLIIICGKLDAASIPGVNGQAHHANSAPLTRPKIGGFSPIQPGSLAARRIENAKNGIATPNGVNTTANDRQFSYDLSTPLSPTDCLARYSLSLGDT
ncbi:hypothetical protein SprV_1002876500 [Sparganum proliferum]